MELTPKQQIVELINNSKNILITTHINPDGDCLGSSLALAMALAKLEKNVQIASSDPIAEMLKFLPKNQDIKTDFSYSKDIIISISTAQMKMEKLGYRNLPEENKLDIIITPKSGFITQKDIFLNSGSSKFDLIFVLDAPDLERVGKIYDENTDLFYETPLVNIDHHPGNSYFGKVNWVELTATSTAEILVSLIESLGRGSNLFDAEIATCLLTGIITDTGSFQHANTTPKSFTVAAQLVAAGARQQEIIQHIYKTKPLSTLKLWGKILSCINEEKKQRFVWSVVYKNDFLELRAQETETAGVVDELLKTVPDIDFAMLFSEKQGGVNVNLRGVGKGVNVAEIARLFGGGGHELAAAFYLKDSNFDEVKDKVLLRIKEYQAKKLGLIANNQISQPLLSQEDLEINNLSHDLPDMSNNPGNQDELDAT